MPSAKTSLKIQLTDGLLCSWCCLPVCRTKYHRTLFTWLTTWLQQTGFCLLGLMILERPVTEVRLFTEVLSLLTPNSSISFKSSLGQMYNRSIYNTVIKCPNSSSQDRNLDLVGFYLFIV
jgi:hypothetical protein